MATKTITKFGISHPLIIAILSGIVAAGGVYGSFVVKNSASGGDSLAHTMQAARVHDGDTIELENGILVRLAEIDAPELHQCGGLEAKAALEKLVTGKNLHIEKHIDGQDDFARLVRFVVVDVADPRRKNILAQEELLKQGFVRYTPGANKRYEEALAAALAHAQTRRKGIWDTCAREELQVAQEAAAKKTGVDEHVLPDNPECIIKGNVSANGFGKQYVLPTCRTYDVIKITPSNGERYFCTEKEAQKAGFVKSKVCY